MTAFDKKLACFFYFIILLTTSAPFFIKHFGQSFLMVYACYVVVVVVCLWVANQIQKRQYRLFEQYHVWVILVFLVAAANWLLFERAQAVSNPSTAPMALIQPAQALFLHGQNPYSVTLYDGAPISPGPGWILINSPLTVSELIVLLMPLYFLAAGIFVAQRSKSGALVFSGMLLLSLNFLQLSFVGHDLPAISLAFVALTLALKRFYENERLLLLLAFLSGVVATARAPLIIVPIAMGVCLATQSRVLGLRFAVIALLSALFFHGIFYFWTANQAGFYQPMHVFGRAAGSISTDLLATGLLLWTAIAVFLKRKLTQSVSTWLVFLWAILAIPFAGVGVAELLRDNVFSLTNWANWEGKGYVMFTLPLLIAGLALDKGEVSG